MKAATAASGIAGHTRSDRFHLWRSRKDRLVRWLIAIGGVAVIWAVVLIFFYLLWVVFPLFLPAETRLAEPTSVPGWSGTRPVYLAVEEQQEVGLRLNGAGTLTFFDAASGATLEETRLPVADLAGIVRAVDAVEQSGLVAAATSTGEVLVFRHRYETRFDGGVESRRIVPVLDFPYGEAPLLQLPEALPARLALSENDRGILVAAATADGWVRLNQAAKRENFLTGAIELEPDVREIRVDFPVSGLAVSGNHRWLYLGDGDGRVHRFDLPGLTAEQVVDVSPDGITDMTMLLGGISLLVGDGAGRIHQLFPVRDDENVYRLVPIRSFEPLDGAIVRILPEQRRKGFLALSAAGEAGIFHSTAGQRVARSSLAGLQPRALALAPRANSLLIEGAGPRLGRLDIDNQHPEISFASLWRKVWYENYDEPQYVWQSSAATNEFEPKFSLTPLVFGTIKAAAYAMLFAIPLALMGAAYTAYFMSPELRKWVKPGIEIMAALPTVILGFLAGLWFAPWVEEHLADLFMMLLCIPPGLLLFAWLWHRWDNPLKDRIDDGWEPLLLLPVLGALAIAASWLADPVQGVLFGGDLRTWLSNEAGISYDQRNALVVGCAMGFAVIPTIFSIAEDAVFGVPKSLSDGSLALGATPWQTLVYVVLPTASPGIFSGLMIGLGRAVGETMIVLMATGNTPVMDWNLFEGMRTLAANIAVEMPESEVNSSHYRILFLAALVLFLFTFVVNTGAELIRQRLRVKYSSL
ncbi:MAG: ABC transporter permease subunit [Xanthomonadales bacterium]|nr:ABC transporter permease subunit [Xanthomonadales bacterium]